MAGLIGAGVTLRGFYNEATSLTWNLTGTIVRADLGKAMSQDTTAPNSAKLALDDEEVIGVLVSFEDRTVEGIKVGSICSQFSLSVPYTGTVPAIGTQVCGSAVPGLVKAATAALATGYSRKANRVVEQNTTAGTVVVHMM